MALAPTLSLVAKNNNDLVDGRPEAHIMEICNMLDSLRAVICDGSWASGTFSPDERIKAQDFFCPTLETLRLYAIFGTANLQAIELVEANSSEEVARRQKEINEKYGPAIRVFQRIAGLELDSPLLSSDQADATKHLKQLHASCM